MQATITGVKGLQRKLNNIQRAAQSGTRKALVKIVSDARNQMIKRTAVLGKDVNNEEFEEYSESYAEEKLDSGRRNTPVNLVYHGNMLRAISTKKTSKGADIYFNNASEEKKARAHNFGRGQKKRQFFGLGNKIKQYIIDEVNKIISKAVKR